MRYLPLTEGDRAEMLAAIGVDGMGALFKDIPESARLTGLLDLPMRSSRNGKLPTRNLSRSRMRRLSVTSTGGIITKKCPLA